MFKKKLADYFHEQGLTVTELDEENINQMTQLMEWEGNHNFLVPSQQSQEIPLVERETENDRLYRVIAAERISKDHAEELAKLQRQGSTTYEQGLSLDRFFHEKQLGVNFDNEDPQTCLALIKRSRDWFAFRKIALKSVDSDKNDLHNHNFEDLKTYSLKKELLKKLLSTLDIDFTCIEPPAAVSPRWCCPARVQVG